MNIVNLLQSKQFQTILNFCVSSYKDFSAVNGRCKYLEESLKMNSEIYTKASKRVAKNEEKPKIKPKVEALKLKQNIDFDKFKKQQEEIKRFVNKKPQKQDPILKKIGCPVS